MPSDVEVVSDVVGGQRKSSTLKQLQTPNLDLSDLPEEIPIDSWSCALQQLVLRHSRVLVLHPGTTGRADRGERHLCLPSCSRAEGGACLAVPPCTGQRCSSFYLV